MLLAGYDEPNQRQRLFANYPRPPSMLVNCRVIRAAQDAQREDCQILVNVFVMRRDGETPSELLVPPLSPEVATQQAYQTAWNYYATIDTGDRIFGDVDAQALETTLARSGFAVITPALDRR